MRRDWDAISKLLDVNEKLAGHPNLKVLRDEANDDLNELLAQPPSEHQKHKYKYRTDETGVIEPVDPLPGHAQDPIDHDQPEDTKLYPELIGGGPASNPTGENTSDPVVRRKLP